jgi:nucleoside 2-deoxyribosyltransferase
LSKSGLRPILSGHGISAGSEWQSALREQIRGADLFVLVMPEAKASSSNSTFFEAGVARAFGKRIAVVVPDLQKVDTTNIPLDLAGSVFTDAGNRPIEEVASRIAGAAAAA